MRVWLSALLMLASVLLSRPMRAAEEVNLNELSPEDREYIEKTRAGFKSVEVQTKDFEDKSKAKLKELEAQRLKLAELGSAQVTIDEETKTVQEPNSMEKVLNLQAGKTVKDEFEVNSDDFDIYVHERWSLELSDFRADRPHYITCTLMPGVTKTYFGFTFSITNNTGKARRIAPFFTAVTNKGVFNQAVGGFPAERVLADSLNRPLADTNDLLDKERLSGGRIAPLEPMVRIADYAVDTEKGTAEFSPQATFAAGQTRYGAALWTNFSNEFTELKIIVHGLSNAHRYEERTRKVLVLTFEKIGDEFNVYRTPLTYKGKSWEYIWMWDQDITVPIPTDPKDPQIKVQKLATPAGGEKLAWAFPFTIKNDNRMTQSIGINSVSFAAPVEVDVGGTKIPIEARIVDDGRSNIYKSQLLKALGKENSKDRFAPKGAPEVSSKTQKERRMVTLESAKDLDVMLAVFDEADVDWQNVKDQVETALSSKLDKQGLAKANWEKIVAAAPTPQYKAALEKHAMNIYDPCRRLTEEEFTSVKEQVSKGIAAAIDAAKAKKTVTAYFNCTSGLSTGTYRISRSYRQPGVVDEAWLKAWEELDKPTQ